MTITPAYIPAPAQTDAQAAKRAAALGVGIAPRDVPPVYLPHINSLPGVIAEYGGGPTVVYLHDDSTITPADVTRAIQPLIDLENTPEPLSPIDTLKAQLAKATTVSAVKSVLSATLDMLDTTA